MKIELISRNVTLVDPFIELEQTIDNPKQKTFQPIVVLIDSENPLIRIGYELPPQPYLNDTWTDEDVNESIVNHLQEISIP